MEPGVDEAGRPSKKARMREQVENQPADGKVNQSTGKVAPMDVEGDKASAPVLNTKITSPVLPKSGVGFSEERNHAIPHAPIATNTAKTTQERHLAIATSTHTLTDITGAAKPSYLPNTDHSNLECGKTKDQSYQKPRGAQSSGIQQVPEATSSQDSCHGNGQEVGQKMAPNDSHFKIDQILDQSCSHLQALKKLLHDNPDFCSDVRRKEWMKKIDTLTETSAPETIIGCLGATGVGKSSLLNALCDEASILPTSGSRGCTATVVELRFNKDLLQPSDKTTVYKGLVEFMSVHEWQDELEALLDLCTVHASQTIVPVRPNERQNPESATAWSKLCEVYGYTTMASYLGHPRAEAWEDLSKHDHVVNLLTGEYGLANTIVVKEGCVDKSQATLLLGKLSGLKGKLRRNQKKWAKSFRSKISDFVNGSGKKGEPQSWPLIRRVVLHGPWAVLSSGARLVDLPGVGDSNAARAAVAQSYLQKCHKIWIVAPIKRAVDDGTANELLGEQFKRRLLMDGKYGAVSFICTHTDICEPEEVMRDHEDVARSLGVWEELSSLDEKIKCLATQLDDDNDDSDDDSYHDDDDEYDDDRRGETGPTLKSPQELREEQVRLQRRLKTLSALVRNEYSTKRLQQDFRAGLEDLTRRDEEEIDETLPTSALNGDTLPPLPDHFQLEVYCVSPNDYQKLEGVKTGSDGDAQAFENVVDTQIPRLRAAVHQATAEFRESFSASLASGASTMLENAYLCATENREVSARSDKFKEAFEKILAPIESQMQPIADGFSLKLLQKVNNNLQPSFQRGAISAKLAAKATSVSWGSQSRRTRQARSPEQNGLHWCTYIAAMVRNGVHTSKVLGQVDLNQELCDPMEKAIASDWQITMDGAVKLYLAESERQVLTLIEETCQALLLALKEAGMESNFLKKTTDAATRESSIAIKQTFRTIKETAAEKQGILHRSLSKRVAKAMKPGYRAAANVERGTGTLLRMKKSVGEHVDKAMVKMFDKAASKLSKAIDDFVMQITTMLMTSSQTLQSSLNNVFSVSWDGDRDINPDKKQKILQCRKNLLPTICQLRQAHDQVLKLAGVERPDVDFEVVRVDDWDERNAKEMKRAQERGAYFDLVDSDDYKESPVQAISSTKASVMVKAEPLATVSTATVPVTTRISRNPHQATIPGFAYAPQGYANRALYGQGHAQTNYGPPATNPSYPVFQKAPLRGANAIHYPGNLQQTSQHYMGTHSGNTSYQSTGHPQNQQTASREQWPGSGWI